ncbi:MAG: DUF4838 domain-containing protein [Armatimonadota bacterium]|nr:DUF4838 domain-containing protein [Armatimonadota bacterium]
MKTVIGFCPVFVVLCAATAQAQLTLATGGKARLPILIHPDATQTERYAAEELASHLQQITGAPFEVREVPSGQTPTAGIIVGPGHLAQRLFPEVELDKFGAEQLTIRTKGNYLLLAGGRPRGTLYAVYRFLSTQCGVRWWTPWATHIPRRSTLRLRPLAIDEKPAFEYREPFWYPAFDGDWAARNLCNSHAARLTEKHGGKVVYKGFVHTFYPLVPPEQYFEKHPEWYSLIGGKRTYQHAQLCCTNPQLREFLVERVRQWLRESPDATIISISQNDWAGPCECEACKAIDEREGTHAGSVLDMVNYIAERLEGEFPHVAFDTLAYQYTRKPTRALRPRHNVIARLCSIECNFAQPLEHPSNQAFADDIRGWSERSNRLYIWDYTTNFAHYVQPHPNYFVLGPNLRFFHQHGVRGVFEQGAYQSHGSEFSELRAWVLAQLLWNPYQDDRKLIDEFLKGYYGKAAPYIKRYMERMHHAAKDFYMTCFTGTNAPFLNFDVLSEAERLWQQAAQAVQDNPELLWRVKQGHLPVRYAFLTNWSRLRRECLIKGKTWPLPLSRKAVAEEWLAVATGSGPQGWTPMTHVNEGGLTPQKFVERFAVDEPDPVLPDAARRGESLPPPADLQGVDPRRCVDAQEWMSQIANEGVWGVYASDPLASDGYAVKMPGNHWEWAYQLPVSLLPPRAQKGKWKVYVVVRVDKKAGVDPQREAFGTGVWDTERRVSAAEVRVRIADTDEKGYRSFLVGTVELHPKMYIWVCPPAAGIGGTVHVSPEEANVRAVWVDRVYLVPAE